MIWAKSGRMHWTSYDIAGLMVDVHIAKGVAQLSVIHAETGEILRTSTFDHPIDAMTEAKRYVRAEEKYVTTRKDECEKAKSQSNTPNPEETCTIQEGNRLPC